MTFTEHIILYKQVSFIHSAGDFKSKDGGLLKKFHMQIAKQKFCLSFQPSQSRLQQQLLPETAGSQLALQISRFPTCQPQQFHEDQWSLSFSICLNTHTHTKKYMHTSTLYLSVFPSCSSLSFDPLSCKNPAVSGCVSFTIGWFWYLVYLNMKVYLWINIYIFVSIVYMHTFISVNVFVHQ